jgi:hypothetical protein
MRRICQRHLLLLLLILDSLLQPTCRLRPPSHQLHMRQLLLLPPQPQQLLLLQRQEQCTRLPAALCRSL